MAEPKRVSAVDRASEEVGRPPRSAIRSWGQRKIEAGYWSIDWPGVIQREMSLSTRAFCELSMVLTPVDDMTLLRGETTIRTGPLQSGRFRVAPANAALSASVSASGPVKFLKVFFAEETARAIGSAIHSHSIDIELEDPMLGTNDPLLVALGREVVENMNDPRPTNRAFAEEAAILMAGRVVSHYSTARYCTSIAVRSPGLDPNLDRALQLMRDHIGDSIDLGMLAASVDMSAFSFVRAFKKKYGLPPIRYHRGMRIEWAKTLLSTTACPVGKISNMLGFSEPSHFVSAFRKTTGCTPLAYRRFRS
ncbi:helix-turn-helix domain-containing protein [Rhodopseudomonas palustris]|uniref:helix-turn-helix domain-containing protein n=1 Tax=Rhodopseudomonas palustris TaxID=1076 RepID=UPI001FDA1B7D|nr:AraC family transcriptional regulator [Rhodopseudomonas palustris]